MEKIHYWDPKCGWYYTPNTNCIDLFPSELEKLAEITASGKFCVVDTWHGLFVFDIHDAGDMWTIHITKCEGRFELTAEIVKSLAIHVLFRKNGVFIDTIKLPIHMNNKVAWALGAKKYQCARSLDDLNKYLDSHQDHCDDHAVRCDDHAVRYDYGKCHAVVVRDWKNEVRDGRYFIDGFLSRDEAISILTKALELNGWYFSSTVRVQYVLDNI